MARKKQVDVSREMLLFPSLTKGLLGILFLAAGFSAATLNTGIVDLHFGYVRNPLITYGGAVLLLFGCILAASFLHGGILTWIGRNTLTLMGLQIGTGYTVVASSKLLGQMHTSVDKNVMAVLDLMAFLMLASFVTVLVNRYFPYIIRMPQKGMQVNSASK